MDKCNKTLYKTEQYALIDLEKIQKKSHRDKVPQRAYFCKKCNGYHLTSHKDFKTQIDELELKQAKLKDILKNYKKYLQEEKTINAELLQEINEKNKKIANQKNLIKRLECKLQNSKVIVKKHPRFKN